MDPDVVLRWAAEELGREGQPKYGANILYDLDFLAEAGVRVAGPFIDVLNAEPLLDENLPDSAYSLDASAGRRLGEGKSSSDLYEWCAAAYGGSPGPGQRANIYRAPAALVGPYAEGDADLPLRLASVQSALLEEQELSELADVENRLIPVLLAMRRRGVRVDAERAARLSEDFAGREATAAGRFRSLSGVDFVDSGRVIAEAFKRLGIDHPTTTKGNPSFTGTFLEHHPSEIAACVREIRRWSKARGTFLDGYVGHHAVRGRIHAEFNQLKRSDDAGGKRGTIARFSSTNPNLQNIPSRDPELGPLVRSLFLPDEGEAWRRHDYSQIEYRLLVHFARGPGAEEARRRYREDPATDYHDYTRDVIAEASGLELDRKPVKNVNFGLTYGMSEYALERMLGLSGEQSEALFRAYHEGVPFAKTTFEKAMATARDRGYVLTALKRRGRFDLWESRDRRVARKDGAMAREAALEKYGSARAITRAYVHAALNRVLQGSAADLMKKAMVDVWESGACDVVGAPLLTVHDELDWSDPGTTESDEAFIEIRRLMCEAIPLRVPVLVDEERGPNWGDLV